MAVRSETRRRADAQKVVEHWGTTLHDVELTFYGFPPLRPYLYRAVAGEKPAGPLGRDWFERWAVEHVLGARAPVGNALSLCCGFGEIERILAGLGAFVRCTAVDVAEAAVAEARRAAAEAQIDDVTYVVADVERIDLEPESVDLVWANGALHHLRELEHVVAEVHRALRPGGVLVANEYVGPDHAQLNRRESELVNAVVHLVPPELRDMSEATFVPSRYRGPRWRELAYRGVTGKLPDRPALPAWQRRLASVRRALPFPRHRRFGAVWANNPWYYEHVDPSEGVRSSEIIATLRRTFEKVEVRAYNGSILPHALDRAFYERFDDSDPGHARLLETLWELEAGLIAAGEIEPHHAALVCVKAG